MDTNLTTGLISEVISIDKDLTTALISAGVSAGVSLTIAFLYWVMEMYKKYWFEYTTFITYKKYIKEFFELYLIALDTNFITYENKSYNIDDLEFYFIIEDGNESEKISDPIIPSLILSLIGEKEILTKDETTLLKKVLGILSSEKWIGHCKKLDNDGKEIIFSYITIISSKINTSLASLDKENFIYSPSSQDTIEKLQAQFKHKEFDKRIRKIIKKNLHLLS